MKRLFSVLALSLLGVGALRAEASFYDGVAAYVNDKVVTVDTVMRELNTNFDLSKIPQEQLAARVGELFPVMRDILVDRILILEAYEASGSQLPNEAVNERIQEIIAKQFGGDEALLRKVLGGMRMTREEWMQKVREDLIVMAMRQLQVDRKIVVSPKRVRDYYAANKAKFAEEYAVRVRSITIDPQGGAAAAQKALEELKAGKPFEEVAKAYSKDSQAAQGGDWGFVDPAANFSAPVVEALQKLKPGAFSEIIAMGEWRTIVQKVEERVGEVPPLESIWPKVEAATRAELGQERYNVWIEGLRKQATIKNVDVKLQ